MSCRMLMKAFYLNTLIIELKILHNIFYTLILKILHHYLLGKKILTSLNLNSTHRNSISWFYPPPSFHSLLVLTCFSLSPTPILMEMFNYFLSNLDSFPSLFLHPFHTYAKIYQESNPEYFYL